jgi:uncharacterized membrane protein YgcG
MSLHAALAASATLVSLAFALSTFERWLTRRRRHEGAWTVSLFLFAAGSAALWVGAAVGWGEWSFKAFYLFGAILNVPFLALGTVELLAGPTHGKRWTAIVSLLAAFCVGLVVSAPLVSFIDPEVLPQGKEVFGAGPRIAAALASGLGATVIFGGAVWSAWRLLRGRRRVGAPSALPAGRLALANLFIAAGTLVLSAGGLLNSVVNEMDGFAISLVVGISIIFVGFLITNSGSSASVRALPEPRAWHARTAQVAAAVVVAIGLVSAPLVLEHRPAAAAGGDVGDYLGRINATRAAAGSAPLVLDSELSGLAQAWAQQLADWQRLQHASDLSVGVTQPWKKLGENVGRGGGTAAIYPAFVASPTHYANIVDPSFTRIGIGVVYGSDGKQYTVQRYLAPPAGGGSSGGGPSDGGSSGASGSSGAGSSGGTPAPTTTTTAPPPPPDRPGPGDPARAAVVLDALQRYER